MLRLAADENLDGRIVRGLQRALPELDLVRVQDTSLTEASDDSVLEWAAREGRVVVTHDVTTMTAAAWARVERGQALAGVIEVSSDEPTGRALDELRLIVVLCAAEEMKGQVLFLPL